MVEDVFKGEFGGSSGMYRSWAVGIGRSRDGGGIRVS